MFFSVLRKTFTSRKVTVEIITKVTVELADGVSFDDAFNEMTYGFKFGSEQAKLVGEEITDWYQL